MVPRGRPVAGGRSSSGTRRNRLTDSQYCRRKKRCQRLAPRAVVKNSHHWFSTRRCNATVQIGFTWAFITPVTSLPSNLTAFSPSQNPLPWASDPTLRRNPASLVRTRTMAESQFKPWSDNPNAPKIRYDLYLWEKINFAGDLVSSILYGTRKISLPTCPSTHPCSLLRLAHPRNAHHAVLRLYHCTLQSSLSQRRGHQVGPRVLHCDHVLVGDHANRVQSQPFIDFLH